MRFSYGDSKKYRYPILLVSVIILLFLAIEAKYPYFFLQDDNRVQNLPLYVANLRALSKGELPLFNFHQFLGTPLLACILSAAFYPFNYVALLLSKLFFGDYFATIEIITLFHLIIAGIGFYSLMRFWRLHERSCVFGAIAWPFCAFVITAGNSWVQIPGCAAYLPWTYLFALQLLKKPNLRHFVMLIITRSLLFFIGYPQFFLYGATFEVITIILIFCVTKRGNSEKAASESNLGNLASPRTIWQFLKWYILHFVCVIMVILPVLTPGMHQTMLSSNRKSGLSWDEYSSINYNVLDWINGLINPFATKGRDLSWSNQFFLSHVGFLTIIFVFVAVFTKKRNVSAYVKVFSALSVITLLYTFNLLLPKLIYLLPIYNKFRWPFKIAFFTSFYLIIISTFGFDTFFKKISFRLQITKGGSCLLYGLIILIHAVNFGIIYTCLPQRAFGYHLDKVPLDEPLKDVLVNGRIVTFGPNYSSPEKFSGLYGKTAPFLGFNYATLWNLYHFGGYEMLLSERNRIATFNINVDANMDTVPFDARLMNYFRIWGVRWYVVEKTMNYDMFTYLQLQNSDTSRKVYFDPLARPLVYWETIANNNNISYNFNPNSVIIDTYRGSDDFLIINILFNEYFKAYIDGIETKVEESQYRQLKVFVPGGSHNIKIAYSDPYFNYSALLTTVFLAICLPLLYKNREHFLTDKNK